MAEQLNRLIVIKMLKPLNCNREVMKLILDNAFMKLKNVNDHNNNNADYKYPKFAVNGWRNFCFNKVTRSLIYLFSLGIIKSYILLIHILGKVFDTEKLLCKGVKNNIE